MKKILIADDEKTIRDGIERLILSTNKYEIVGKCKNGEEALAIANKTEPDIVVTDIRMPIMDGLSFISSYNSKKTTKFIILSGYGEFEYARKAHTLDVFDYLLKPVDYCKFLEILQKASDEIDENLYTNDRKFRQLALLSLQLSLSSLAEIKNLISELEINYTNIIPVVISTTKPYGLTSDYLSERRDFIEKFISRKGINNSITVIYEQRIVSLIYDTSRNAVMTMLNGFLSACNEEFGCMPYCSVGDISTDVYGLEKCYENALFALSYSLYNKDKHIYEVDDNMFTTANWEIYYYKDKNLVASAIKESDKDKATEYTESLIKRAVEENYPPKILFYFFKEIYTFCYNNVYIFKNDKILNFDVNGTISKAVYNIISLEELKETMLDIIYETIDTLDQKSDTKSNTTIEDVIKFINLNYRNEITLDSISSTFFINKSYFCKIFKEKTDTTFNNYLTTLRINKAKNLILEDKLKIYEIAEMVGFKDPKYFAKTFKDFTGLTPSEYKVQSNTFTV